MELNDLFEIKYGTSLELNSLDKTNDGINFVSRTTKNNGVSAKVSRVKHIETIPAGTISVALGGNGVLTCCVQPSEYYSGRDVAYLIPRKDMNLQEKLFYCVAIRMNQYKYSYGRQANKTLKQIKIPEFKKLPKWVNDKIVLNISDKKPLITKNFDLNVQKWKYISLSKLFNITGTKTTTLTELKKKGVGVYPYVTTQATNNGVDGFFNYFTEEGNVLTVDSAVVGFVSYQEEKFSASDHVEKLSPLFKMNKYIALFLVTILNKEQYRYNYGRKSSQERLQRIRIKLPVNTNNEPDFKFMEYYIKSLPYSQSL